MKLHLCVKIMQKDVAWHWYAKHDKAITRIKHLIVSSPVLGLYDVNEQVSRLGLMHPIKVLML